MIPSVPSATGPHRRPHRRRFPALTGLVATMLLAGCAVVPKPGPPPPPPPPPSAETKPTATELPVDGGRHRIALLVPMSGTNAWLGQALANATTMALLDTNAQSLRITTYDTAANGGGGAAGAATRAIEDHNQLILGPLTTDEVPAVARVAQPAKVPLITFANDPAVADRNVFVLGQIPGQSISRVLSYAHARGVNRIDVVIPMGVYGQRVASSLGDAARASGVTVVDVENYERNNTSVLAAVRKARSHGQVDAVLVADNARIAMLAAPSLGGVRALGTELWAPEATITRTPGLTGAWFAALSDERYGTFLASYRTRFSAAPPRMAAMGYDAVLLTLSIARTWKPGAAFPINRMFEPDGFIGVDGVFRFNLFGVAERAYEVREVGIGSFLKVSPAPARLGN